MDESGRWRPARPAVWIVSGALNSPASISSFAYVNSVKTRSFEENLGKLAGIPFCGLLYIFQQLDDQRGTANRCFAGFLFCGI
jgi:hypothetical protein